MYLPPYSPDLNGIELVWSQVKSRYRKSHLQVVSGGGVPDVRGLAIEVLDHLDDDEVRACARHGYVTLMH